MQGTSEGLLGAWTVLLRNVHSQFQAHLFHELGLHVLQSCQERALLMIIAVHSYKHQFTVIH